MTTHANDTGTDSTTITGAGTVVLECYGEGAAGGNGKNANGPGDSGASGGYSKKTFTVTGPCSVFFSCPNQTPLNTAGGSDGGDGGNATATISALGITVVANGGKSGGGATGSRGTQAAGGTASGGDTNLTGNPGNLCTAPPTTNPGAAGANGVGPLGGTGGAGGVSSVSPGGNGTNYGAGGGGGVKNNNPCGAGGSAAILINFTPSGPGTLDINNAVGPHAGTNFFM